MYYKGCTGATEDRRKTLLNEEFERLKLVEEERKNGPKMQCKDFFNQTAAMAILIAILMSWFSQATGCYIIVNYASLIFEKSGFVWSVNVSAIILAAMQIVGGLVSARLGDSFGRKTIFNISLIGSIIGLLSLSAYTYVQHNDHDVSNYAWLPLVLTSFIIFITSSGIIAIINTYVIECFPSKVRKCAKLIRTHLFFNLMFKFDMDHISDSNSWHDLVFAL